MINFLLEQKYAAANTFNKAGWRNRYTWSRGQSRTMIDFFLCPMRMLNGTTSQSIGAANGTCKSTTEQYTSDYLKQPITKRKDGHHQEKREVRDPREFGERAEGTVNNTEPSNMHSLDKWFAEIASTMKEKTPRRRIAKDPRIKELIMRRIALPRSHDGRARKELTQEIRKQSSERTQETRKKEAVKEAFARHTNWAKTANEMRINRPFAAPIFGIEGRTTTSDEEAIEAIAKHIENIYKEPEHPIDIPPWNPNHGIEIDSIEKAVSLAVLSAKKKAKHRISRGYRTHVSRV